jgi:hypothetical protein
MTVVSVGLGRFLHLLDEVRGWAGARVFTLVWAGAVWWWRVFLGGVQRQHQSYPRECI